MLVAVVAVAAAPSAGPSHVLPPLPERPLDAPTRTVRGTIVDDSRPLPSFAVRLEPDRRVRRFIFGHTTYVNGEAVVCSASQVDRAPYTCSGWRADWALVGDVRIAYWSGEWAGRPVDVVDRIRLYAGPPQTSFFPRRPPHPSLMAIDGFLTVYGVGMHAGVVGVVDAHGIRHLAYVGYPLRIDGAKVTCTTPAENGWPAFNCDDWPRDLVVGKTWVRLVVWPATFAFHTVEATDEVRYARNAEFFLGAPSRGTRLPCAWEGKDRWVRVTFWRAIVGGHPAYVADALRFAARGCRPSARRSAAGSR